MRTLDALELTQVEGGTSYYTGLRSIFETLYEMPFEDVVDLAVMTGTLIQNSTPSQICTLVDAVLTNGLP